ncbi:MAG: hydrogenase, partial [Gemmatimonadetes bacterium]|nr:hydrogenase [Gemmatimonadota bacterium]
MSLANSLTDTSEDVRTRPPLILGDNDFASVTEKVCRVVETSKTPKAWWALFGLSATVMTMLLAMIGYLFYTGVGVWGVNNPVGWGFAIVNLVWWIGIGHAGTLISAILLLLRQQWRTSINRFAEAMT